MERNVDLTINCDEVKVGGLYEITYRGGLIVKANSKSKNGVTEVEYLKKNGKIGKYLECTNRLDDTYTNPLDILLFSKLFDDKLEIKNRSEICKEIFGDRDLGDYVRLASGPVGVVIGNYCNSIRRKDKGLTIQRVDVTGNICITNEPPEFTTVLGESERKIVNYAISEFGYAFNNNSDMMISKFGDRKIYGWVSDGMWEQFDFVSMIGTGKNGVISKISGTDAEVWFIGNKNPKLIKLSDIRYRSDQNLQNNTKRALCNIIDKIKERISSQIIDSVDI